MRGGEKRREGARRDIKGIQCQPEAVCPQKASSRGQSQTAVTAYWKSKQLLLFAFVKSVVVSDNTTIMSTKSQLLSGQGG